MKTKRPKKLTIRLEGETHDWEFIAGGYCGKANDSVSVNVGRYAACMLREDVIKLRDFLTQASESWDEVPIPFKARLEKSLA